MDTSRRDFTKLLGAAMAAPLMPALGKGRVPGLSLLGRAELEVQEAGEVSAETAKTMLEVQGMHSIYDDPEQWRTPAALLERVILPGG